MHKLGEGEVSTKPQVVEHDAATCLVDVRGLVTILSRLRNPGAGVEGKVTMPSIGSRPPSRTGGRGRPWQQAAPVVIGRP